MLYGKRDIGDGERRTNELRKGHDHNDGTYRETSSIHLILVNE